MPLSNPDETHCRPLALSPEHTHWVLFTSDERGTNRRTSSVQLLKRCRLRDGETSTCLVSVLLKQNQTRWSDFVKPETHSLLLLALISTNWAASYCWTQKRFELANCCLQLYSFHSFLAVSVSDLSFYSTLYFPFLCSAE